MSLGGGITRQIVVLSTIVSTTMIWYFYIQYVPCISWDMQTHQFVSVAKEAEGCVTPVARIFSRWVCDAECGHLIQVYDIYRDNADGCCKDADVNRILLLMNVATDIVLSIVNLLSSITLDGLFKFILGVSALGVAYSLVNITIFDKPTFIFNTLIPRLFGNMTVSRLFALMVMGGLVAWLGFNRVFGEGMIAVGMGLVIGAIAGLVICGKSERSGFWQVVLIAGFMGAAWWLSTTGVLGVHQIAFLFAAAFGFVLGLRICEKNAAPADGGGGGSAKAHVETKPETAKSSHEDAAEA